MKKLALSTLLILLMVSCTFKDDEPETYWKVVTISINTNDWKAYTDNQGLNLYYACEVQMPEITSYVYTNGLIHTYYFEEKPSFQESLPYVRHYENNTNLWTTTVDCAYSRGAMTFYVTSSDFAAVRPPSMNFRVVVTW